MKGGNNKDVRNMNNVTTLSDRDSAPGSVTNDDSSTTSPFNQSSGRASEIPEDIMTSRETRAVKWSRLMVVAVLIASAAVSGTIIWYWSNEAEKRNFESQVGRTEVSFLSWY